MKKLNYLVFMGILVGFLFTTSCKKDDEPTPQINESEVLATFLESAESPYGKDYVNTDMSSITSAADVYQLSLTGQVYIIDIRAAADFASGHIEDAVNIPLGQVLDHIKTINHESYEKVVVVCYGGQSASYATSLLRINGYKNVFSMGFGMSSWNEVFSGPWTNAVSNAYQSQFTSDVTPMPEKGELPAINTGKTTGLEILEERTAELLAAGFSPCGITAQAVFDNLSSFYVVNYWPEAQYLDPGHIPGAVQYTPKQSMKLAADLKTLPTDKPIAIYCYTGQGSGFLSAYLRLLGYDARSVMFGGSGMIWDMLNDREMPRFTQGAVQDFPYWSDPL
jgi:rhodanese-related sulfurtransferase